MRVHLSNSKSNEGQLDDHCRTEVVKSGLNAVKLTGSEKSQ